MAFRLVEQPQCIHAIVIVHCHNHIGVPDIMDPWDMFIPDTLDLSLIDRVERVGNEEAIEFARRLPREEGILAGLSCGAAAAAAVRIGKKLEFAGKTIVVILPDSGERYLSTVLYEGLFDAQTGL